MPLLKHRNQPPENPPEPEQTPLEHSPDARDNSPKRKGSIFSWRRRSSFSDDPPTGTPSTDHDAQTSVTHDNHDHDGRSRKRGGILAHRQAGSSSDNSTSGESNRFGNKTQQYNDPSIIAARQKVSEAEEAERHADQALVEARASVRAAREHVENLEREIEEEARLHRLKEKEAKQVSKSIKGLGRYG